MSKSGNGVKMIATKILGNYLAVSKSTLSQVD